MASTIYYGKSTSAANEVNKVINTDLTFDALEEGDILSVYFSNRNDSNGIKLVIPNTSGNISIVAYNNRNLPIQAGTWGDGSIVNFIYVCYDSQLGLYCWRIISEQPATDTTYGSVVIDNNDDDNSAVSLGQVKNLITTASVGELSYTSVEFEEGITIGTLTLTSYVDGSESSTEATIEIPKSAVLPTDLSYFTNDAGYITNETEENLTFTGISRTINISDENNTFTTIDLQDDNNGLHINSLENIYLQPAQPDIEHVGTVYVGSESIPADLNVQGTIDTTYLNSERGAFSNVLTANSAIIDHLEINTNGSAILRNVTVDSLTIGEASINNYVADKITTSLPTEAYRIFTSGAKNIIWKWHTSKEINLAPGAYEYQLYIGDYGIEGYRAIGIISWECFHADKGTSPWLANLYGFYWGLSEVSGKNDALYAKVYNVSSKDSITKLKVKACVLLMRDTAWP